MDTGHETWVFDGARRRFCRVPRGRDPHDPRVAATWRPYFEVQPGANGGFTVVLDAQGTRRYRVLVDQA